MICITSCKLHKPCKDDPCKISNIFWSKNFPQKTDSALLIIKSKETRLFKFYLVTLTHKPIEVPDVFENNIELVDDNTIYFDLKTTFNNNPISNKKDLIRISNTKISVGDENYDGQYYVFNRKDGVLYTILRKEDFIECRWNEFKHINDDIEAYDSTVIFLAPKIK